MDGYVMGFLAVMAFMGLVTIGALLFISFDHGEPTHTDTRVSLYTTVRLIDTNTIETVDMAGDVQIWQRGERPTAQA